MDIDFQELLEENKVDPMTKRPNLETGGMRTYVCVRKRILFEKEAKDGQIDCVSIANPLVRVGEPKYRIDGITKYVENQEYLFDNTFGDEDSTDDLYTFSVKPTLDQIFNDGVSTVFAYGQTGSGKTYTMEGIQKLAINDIF